MPLLSLSVEPRFHDELIRLPRDAQKKVIRVLGEMRRNPNHLSKQLEGQPGIWRREAAPYRILFAKGGGWVHVYSVAHRQGVYSGSVALPKELPQTAGRAFDTMPRSDVEPSTAVPPSAWEVVSRVMDCERPDDLYGLIDLGLPDALFDTLYTRLEQLSTQHPSGNVRLLRRDVLDGFFGRLIRRSLASAPAEVLIAAPWITPWHSAVSSFDGAIRYLRSSRARTIVITRPPHMVRHKLACDALMAVPRTEMVYVENLHAKFFICDGAPIPFALIGSANSTMQSFSNYEVGIAITGAGGLEGIIRDLQGLGTELRGIGQSVRRATKP